MTVFAELQPAARRALVRARAATLALFFTSGAGLGIWAANIPLLKSGLGLDDSELGLVLLGMGVGAVAGMPTASVLIHRFGAVAVSVGSGVGLAAALALPAHAPSHPALIVCAFLVGVGVGVIDIAMNAHAAAVERAFGRPIMSSIHAFFSIGGLCGGAAGAGMIGLGASAGLGMGVAAAALAAIVAAAGGFLAFSEREERAEGHGLAWPSAAVLGLGALAICSFLGEGAIMEWSAVFLRDVTGAPFAIAAGGYAAFSAAMTVGRLLGDRFVGWLGPARAVAWSGALATIALIIVTTAPNYFVAYAGIALAGLGYANIVPPLFSAAARVPGVAPAAALAMIATLGYGGGLLGPPAIGFLSDAFGLRTGFMVLIAAAAVIALFAVRTISPPERPRRG